MPTVSKKTFDISPTPFSSGFPQISSSSNQEKRLKVREFISWSACFGFICAVTGLLKFLKIGVTMDSVTSTLFYLSLAGLIYFVTRIILLTKNPVPMDNAKPFHELN
jgi:hypothetical protein